VPLIAASEDYKTANYWKNFSNITLATDGDIISNVMIDNIYYDICNSFAIVVGSEKLDSTLSIPREITYNSHTYLVTSIGSDAFSDCKEVTSITISNSVTSIGYSAFDGCKNINIINSYNTTPPSCYTATFSNNVYSNATVYVPKESLDAYKEATGWSRFDNLVAMPDDVPISALTLPDSVSIEIGKTMAIEAVITPEDATNDMLTWKSSNEAIATVDSLGNVTAVAVGTAIITASTTDGSNICASTVVTVHDPELIANTMTPQNVETLKGRPVEVSIEMNNTYNIIAFQTDIYLSEGLDFTCDDEDGTFVFNGNSSRFTSSHTFSSARQSSGAVRIVVVSMSNKKIKGNSGELFTIPLQVRDGYTGPFTVELKNTIITDDSKKDHRLLPTKATVTIRPWTPGDVNDDGIFTVADAALAIDITLGLPDDEGVRVDEAADINTDGEVTTSDIASIIGFVLGEDDASAKAPTRIIPDSDTATEFTDHMYINDVTVEPGETKTVEMGVINEKTYIACQFDVYLPEGFEIATDDGDYIFDLDPSRKANNHSVSSAAQSSGAVRAVIVSMTNKAFKGNEGTLVSFPMIVPQDFSGETTARVSKIIFTDDSKHDNYLPEVEFKITSVNDIPTGINEIDGNNVEIYSTLGNIYVKNVATTETVSIYNVNGSLIYSGTGDCKVSVAKGIYVVMVGNKATKIAVK
jgi:hypothetical protein